MAERASFAGRLAILGAVRNGGAGLEPTLAGIEALRTRLKETRLFIATNDNVDRTDEILADCEGPSTEIIRLDGIADAIPIRVDRIAAARNFLLERLARLPDPPEMTLILDLDGPNAHLPVDTLLDLMQRDDRPWDALFANQSRAYYDLWALRHPVWCPGDCWREVRWAWIRTLGLRRRSYLRNRIVHARQYLIPPTTDWIEVDSAFGGLGLYRTAALKGHWYNARGARSERLVEHVVLHRSMRRAGSRLFIAPELLNEAPDEHLGKASGGPFPYSAAELSL